MFRRSWSALTVVVTLMFAAAPISGPQHAFAQVRPIPDSGVVHAIFGHQRHPTQQLAARNQDRQQSAQQHPVAALLPFAVPFPAFSPYVRGPAIPQTTAGIRQRIAPSSRFAAGSRFSTDRSLNGPSSSGPIFGGGSVFSARSDESSQPESPAPQPTLPNIVAPSPGILGIKLEPGALQIVNEYARQRTLPTGGSRRPQEVLNRHAAPTTLGRPR